MDCSTWGNIAARCRQAREPVLIGIVANPLKPQLIAFALDPFLPALPTLGFRLIASDPSRATGPAACECLGVLPELWGVAVRGC